MTYQKQQARQARIRRSLDGVVAAYIRDISARNGELSGGSVRALPDRRAAGAALAPDRDRAAA
jgi:hypothetical protein